MVGEDRVIMCEESGRESFVWEEIRLTFVDPHPQQASMRPSLSGSQRISTAHYLYVHRRSPLL